MPKIGNQKSVTEIPCERCGNRRKVAKTWTEKIKNEHSEMILYHQQIICTDKECQKAFEKIMRDEERKRRNLKLAKEGNNAKKPPKKVKSTYTSTITNTTPKATA